MHRSPRGWLALSLLPLLACGGDSDVAGAGGAAGSYGGSSQVSAGAAGALGDAGAAGQDVVGVCKDAKLCADNFHTPAGVGVPPPPPGDGKLAEGGPSVLIVSRVFLGDAAGGAFDPDGWKQSGFDLDGWSSTPEQGVHCRARSGGKNKSIRTDGKNGIDNAFGQGFVGETLAQVSPDPLGATNEAIAAGGPTMMIRVDALGAASDYSALTGGVLIGQSAEAPTDWATSSWRPWSSPASVAFSQAYLTGNTLVAWLAGPVVVPLRLAGKPLRVTVRSARLTVDLGDRAHGVKGMIGGIVDPAELFSASAATSDLMPVCDDPTYSAIRKRIEAYADILKDGTQDPTRDCDGISLGLGFETRTALAGESVTPPAIFNPCPAP